MKRMKKMIWLGTALTILAIVQAWSVPAPARWNALTVVQTVSGQWLCGPAFVIDGMEGPYRPTMPFGNVPSFTPAGRWYKPYQPMWPVPPATPWMSRPVFPAAEPAQLEEVRCKPLFMPRPPWPMVP